jgi:hypothetical protein
VSILSDMKMMSDGIYNRRELNQNSVGALLATRDIWSRLTCPALAWRHAAMAIMPVATRLAEPIRWHDRLTWRSTELSVFPLSFRDGVMLGTRNIGNRIMNKRGMSIVGAMGILCLVGFALAAAQAIPVAPGISAIHQIATGHDQLIQVRKKSTKRTRPTSRGRVGGTGSGMSGMGAGGGGTGTSMSGMGAGGGGGY